MRTLLRIIATVWMLAGPLAWATPGKQAACHPDVATVAVADGWIQYAELGESDGLTSPVVLLHGLFANKEQWGEFMCVLAGSGYRVIAPDLPGHGQSGGHTGEDYRLERQAELLGRFLDTLGLPPVHLAGNSMGGTIAAILARQAPSRVIDLALIGAPMGIVPWSAAVRDALRQGRNPFIPLTLEALEEELALLLVRPPVLSPELKAGLIADYQARQPHYQQVWQTVNGEPVSLCDASPGPKVATWGLWGSLDGIFSHHEAPDPLSCPPGSRWTRLEGEGHLPHLEAVDKTARAYLRFIQAPQPK